MQTSFLVFRRQRWTFLLALIGSGLVVLSPLFRVPAWAGVAEESAKGSTPNPGKLSPTERMKTAHLKAAHEDAERWQQTRKTLPSVPGLHDYKAILHAH